MGMTLHVKAKHEPLMRMVETREEEWAATRVWVRTEFPEEEGTWFEVTPERSLRLRNHSPTGFSWGYGGSGPAQLALAILHAATDRGFAERYYMRFKDEVIANLDFNAREIAFSVDVERWLAGQNSAVVIEEGVSA